MSGTPDINVDDWEQNSEYGGGFSSTTPVVQWLWEALREMTREERSQVLHFCTGAVGVPVGGFAALMGYNGQQHPFSVSRSPSDDRSRLPTASTCFNTLYLAEYASVDQLRSRLYAAVTGAEGFHEGAVAV